MYEMFNYLKYQVWYISNISLWQLFSCLPFLLLCEGSSLDFQTHVLVCDYLLNCLLQVALCKSWINQEFALFSSMRSTVELLKRWQFKVFDKDVANKRTVPRWFEMFGSGDFYLQIEPPRRRPENKVNNDQLKAAVEADINQTRCGLAARFDVTAARILNHLI